MPAITIAQLDDAALDVQHIADIATSTSATATDRLGHTKDTVTGAMSKLAEYPSRGAWAAATPYVLKELVSSAGTWYVCVVPHTSSAAFATDQASKWRVYQGLTTSEVAAPSGAALMGFQASGAGAVPTTVESKLRENISVKDKGAVGDGVADDTAAIWTAKKEATGVSFPAGTYLVGSLPNGELAIARTLRGDGNVVLKHAASGAIAWVTFASDTITENLKFVCQTPVTGLRASIENAVRTTVRNCHFEGFNAGTINDPLTDGWGLYVKNAKHCVIESPTFANNGQSDLCFVDSCENITIINPASTSHDGIVLNVEPNSLGLSSVGLRGASFIGGRFTKIALLEPELILQSSYGLLFNGATVDMLYYSGAGAKFVNSDVRTISGSTGALVFGGQLELDNFDLSGNLLSDSKLMLIGSDAALPWIYSATGTGSITRLEEDGERFVRFNPLRVANDTAVAIHRDYTSCTGGETLVFAARARVNNQISSMPQICTLTVRNSGGSVIQTTTLAFARGDYAASTGWRNEVCVVTMPAGAFDFRLTLGKIIQSGHNASVDISAFGIFRPTYKRGKGNWADVLKSIFDGAQKLSTLVTKAPSWANSPGYFVGERWINSVPTVGQSKGGVCTVAGSPGTWVSEGNL